MFIYSAQSNQGGNGEKFREKKNGISYFWKSLCFTIFVIFKHFKGPLWAIIQENDNQKKKTNKKQMIQRHPYLQILIDEHQSTELCFEPSKFYIIICSFSFFCSIWQWRKIWFSSGIAVMQCNYSYWFFFPPLLQVMLINPSEQPPSSGFCPSVWHVKERIAWKVLPFSWAELELFVLSLLSHPWISDSFWKKQQLLWEHP